jgi:transcriptional regulator with XRE-family HTH domain
MHANSSKSFVVSLSLGALLAAIREGEGWSQAHMGEVLGVSRAHVCDIEKGRRLVTPDRAVRWANKVGYGEKQQQGAYLGLEVLGFLGRWSSRLVSEVAQAALLCPSLEVAHTVRERRGLALDVKTLRDVRLRFVGSSATSGITTCCV